jgi:hypothetical protein
VHRNCAMYMHTAHYISASQLSSALSRCMATVLYRRCLLLHRSLAKPLRLVSVAHDARMRSYRWQHICLVQPVDPPRGLRCTDILAPAVVGVRADVVDRDDAAREVSTKLGTARANVLDDLGCACWRVAEHP